MCDLEEQRLKQEGQLSVNLLSHNKLNKRLTTEKNITDGTKDKAKPWLAKKSGLEPDEKGRIVLKGEIIFVIYL